MDVRVGDIVKVVDCADSHWNLCKMSHWMGKIVQIRELDYTHSLPVKLKDDQEENEGDGWYWLPSDFIPASNIEISDYLKQKIGVFE